MSDHLTDYEFTRDDFDADELEQLDGVFGLDQLDRGLPECSRCTATPTDRSDLLTWAEVGTWGPFYEDDSPGGFCPPCEEWMEGPG
jgi:hypothetical protein